MKKLLSLIILTLLTTSCANQNNLNQLPLNNPVPVNQEINANAMEKFNATVTIARYDNTRLVLEMDIRGVVRKHQDTYFEIVHEYADKTQNILSEGSIRFGKNGNLYFEDFIKKNEYKYYKIGTFNLNNGIRPGQKVEFNIDANFKMKMKWQTLIPGLNIIDGPNRLNFFSKNAKIIPESRTPEFI